MGWEGGPAQAPGDAAIELATIVEVLVGDQGQVVGAEEEVGDAEGDQAEGGGVGAEAGEEDGGDGEGVGEGAEDGEEAGHHRPHQGGGRAE